MDIVEFFKTVNRLCKNQSGCAKCPIWEKGMCMAGFDDNLVKSIEETISKVEQWAKDNPIKTCNTRQSEFLKMFPNAPIDEDNGILCIRPCDVDESIGCTNEKGCDGCSRKYWLTEVTNNEN